ncbi:hypothetical protein ACEU6E_01075 [Halorutilales archaeon Cl-col2-1]
MSLKMQTLEMLYAVFSFTVAAAGMSLVAVSVRAHMRTQRTDMVYLSVGFVLIVAASIGTAVSAFLVDFSRTQSLLTVNNLITTVGFLFVMYSLVPDS